MKNIHEQLHKDVDLKYSELRILSTINQPTESQKMQSKIANFPPTQRPLKHESETKDLILPLLCNHQYEITRSDLK